MKKIFIFLNLLILTGISISSSFALDPKYTVHTSSADIEFKKKKVMEWYAGNVDGNKFYWYDAKKHVSWLKNRTLRWYKANITDGKFYFVHSDKELDFTKKKALRWFENNNLLLEKAKNDT
ncbi:MAG: hypothetical protein HY094_03385 [Candidatus Melainabacteria bacterium]|nr:hypothetical protein [Candidatus Melainabacteria bacterium]